jgi:hypothetical protein
MAGLAGNSMDRNGCLPAADLQRTITLTEIPRLACLAVSTTHRLMTELAGLDLPERTIEP